MNHSYLGHFTCGDQTNQHIQNFLTLIGQLSHNVTYGKLTSKILFVEFNSCPFTRPNSMGNTSCFLDFRSHHVQCISEMR